MFRLILIKLPQQLRPRASPICHGYLFSTSSLKPISELPNITDPKSLTVSFLRNSCGLSLELAASASKKLNIENIENPNSVLDLLRTHGLTQNQIRQLISSRPSLLSADLGKTLVPNMELFKSLGFSGASLAKMLSKDPRVLESDALTVVEFFRAHGFRDEQISTLTMKRPTLYILNTQKIFKPKFEFFKSLGFSCLEIAKLLSVEPYILERSLENKIIPCVQELRRILGTDENVLKAVKACFLLIECNVERVLLANISILLSHGVPNSLVVKIFLMHPRSLLLRTCRFSEVVDEVMKLGFDPNNLLFVLAIRSMAVMSKALWEKKVEALRSFGLSKDEIDSAFKLQPMCMITSEKKIRKVMGFFVNNLKMKPSMISKNPNLLLLSLEKRIIPRCSVLQLLMSKGLIKEDTGILQMFRMTKKKFFEKLVKRYENEVPDVIRAYQGKTEFQGFPIDLRI
ncbi:hypothetical protein I3843_12G038100 [Carya illinoinensis]|uniref:Uncharacterized protein n=1 Tax=Carya illinoinensis TaxID=32201 RepID=A0A8T1NWX4_CARIL|nr:uncharacterized protein LOC122290239 [Carya illinoinensis]KAG2676133.1 hypothetical protein I3760_12G038000 [Carya illinoinensis]KAG2676134.1 hypothetical protein I3760_12G038000 [Carya illinoinensis]KAG6633297.1 hypothetical protein CIPAW_12G038700 [Carya illinoinensis]KAG7952033.1 hypothetical protein I3843_12G038100 [Carya illinoinensis]KAG7952034.1 hypothetical protein I3843_12G038100 [Carya illinoinensis]